MGGRDKKKSSTVCHKIIGRVRHIFRDWIVITNLICGLLGNCAGKHNQGEMGIVVIMVIMTQDGFGYVE